MRTLIGSLYSQRAFNLLGMLVINLDVESKFDDFNCYLDANRAMRVYVRDDKQVTTQKYYCVGDLLTHEVRERCLKFSNWGESNNFVYLSAPCWKYERDLRMRHKTRSNRHRTIMRNKRRKEKTKTQLKKENCESKQMRMAAQEANLFAQDLIQAFQNVGLSKEPIRNY